MVEIEAKLRGHPNLRRVIERLGGKSLGVVDQEDIYLFHPRIEMKDCALRVRIECSNNCKSVKLCYKGPRLTIGMVKQREEIEVHVDDLDKLLGIFRNLGFEVVATVKKKREIFSLGKVEIHLDDVEELGMFLEIEGNSRSEIEKVISELGLSEKEVERRTYLEMLLGG